MIQIFYLIRHKTAVTYLSPPARNEDMPEWHEKVEEAFRYKIKEEAMFVALAHDGIPCRVIIDVFPIG